MGNGSSCKAYNNQVSVNNELQNQPVAFFNAQAQSPSKPQMGLTKLKVRAEKNDSFEIVMSDPDNQPEEIESPVRESKFTRTLSPKKIRKVDDSDQQYFLELLQQDQGTRKRSRDYKTFSPVRQVDRETKQHKQQLSGQLILEHKIISLQSTNLDEAFIHSPQFQPRPILKKKTSLDKSLTTSQKKVRFGRVSKA